MTEWKKICLLKDIPVLGSRRVSRPKGLDVAIFRNDKDQVFALLDHCPHKGGKLSQGIVMGTTVACPLHNWYIEMGGEHAGCAKAPDEGCTPAFQVKIEADVVHLHTHELATLALTQTTPIAGPTDKTNAK